MDFKDYFSGNKIATGVIFVLLGLVLVMGGYYLYLNRPQETQNQVTTKAEEVDKTCGVLEADNNITEGPSPLKVVLRGKINGSVDEGKAVCQWKLDGADLYTSFPVNNSCVFGKDPIVTTGEHTVSYSIEGKKCEQSKKVIVK